MKKRFLSTKTGEWKNLLYLGRLRCRFVRGQESLSFEYDPTWLGSFSLGLDLALFRGCQYVPLDKRLFGLFADSSPDRWGRLLMKRKEANAL